jgi:Tfp pilus assembly protein PilN
MRTGTLHIDFAPGARRISRGGVLLLLASVLLLGAGLFQAAQLVAARTHAQAALSSIEAQRADGAARTTPGKPDPRQVALVRATRQVASDLMTPWARLLSSLGSTTGKDVALLSVEPSVAKRSVRLTAEARDANDMLAYVAALQRDSRLSSVVLVSHQLQVQAPGTPVRFQIQAQWGETP